MLWKRAYSQDRDSQRGPLIISISGNIFEMQILQPLQVPTANWIRTSGYATHNLCFNKHFRWFWRGLTSENHYFKIRETLDKNLTIGHQEDSVVSLSFGRCLKIDWAHPKSNEFIMLQEHRLLAMGSVLRRNFEQVNGG